MEAINKEILIEGVDPRELYGAQDIYLELMRELSPKVKVVARGSSLKALGAKRDVEAFERNALNERRGLIEEVEPRYRYPYFSHIFDGGYSAGYYFYTWAEVLDKDAFEAFRESGDLFNRTISARLRTLLESGGSQDGL